VPIEILRAESERQASAVLGMALRNRDRLQQIIHEESIDCDFCPRGWIYLAHTESEEQGLFSPHRFLRKQPLFLSSKDSFALGSSSPPVTPCPLPTGSIFGQVSLISGQARTATCSMRNDGVILELERKPCETFLSAGSPTALKFLAALNQDLISALRGADQRLLQLCGWAHILTYDITLNPSKAQRDATLVCLSAR
jgi:hypothetical protein